MRSRLDAVPALVWGVAFILLGIGFLTLGVRVLQTADTPRAPVMERLIYDGVAAPPSPTPPPI